MLAGALEEVGPDLFRGGGGGVEGMVGIWRVGVPVFSGGGTGGALLALGWVVVGLVGGGLRQSNLIS